MSFSLSDPSSRLEGALETFYSKYDHNKEHAFTLKPLSPGEMSACFRAHKFAVKDGGAIESIGVDKDFEKNEMIERTEALYESLALASIVAMEGIKKITRTRRGACSFAQEESFLPVMKEAYVLRAVLVDVGEHIFHGSVVGEQEGKPVERSSFGSAPTENTDTETLAPTE